MKVGSFLSFTGGAFTVLGNIFFENTPVLKFTFLIVGILFAAIGVMLLTKSSRISR